MADVRGARHTRTKSYDEILSLKRMKMCIINRKYYNKVFETPSSSGCSKMLKILLFPRKVLKMLKKHEKSFRCLALL